MKVFFSQDSIMPRFWEICILFSCYLQEGISGCDSSNFVLNSRIRFRAAVSGFTGNGVYRTYMHYRLLLRMEKDILKKKKAGYIMAGTAGREC